MPQFTYGLTKLLGHGHAFSEVVTVPSPAANAGFTYTVGSQYWELLDSLSFRLVSDSNAANRQVLLTINDGDGIPLAAFPAASVQAASLTYDYFFLANLSSFNAVVGTTVTSPLFAGFMQPTYTAVVTIAAKQAGDQVTRIRVGVERFVTGPQGYLLGVRDEDDPRVTGPALAATLVA